MANEASSTTMNVEQLLEAVTHLSPAELHVDMEHGKLIVHMRHCEISNGPDKGFFMDKSWPIDLPDDVLSPKVRTRASHMDWDELGQRQHELISQVAKKDREIEEKMVELDMPEHAPNLPEHIRNLQNQRQNFMNELANFEAEINLRPALALGDQSHETAGRGRRQMCLGGLQQP